MKLAEGLSIRKDLQTRIEQLKARLLNNTKVQEGDQPSEQPAELMKELDECLEKLEGLIWRINATNMQTTDEEGKTLTQLMAEKDILTMGPLCVLPEYQRRGIGKALLEHTFAKASEMGYDVVIHFGNPDNYVARGYKSCLKYNVCFEGDFFPSALLVKELKEGILDGRKWFYYPSDVDKPCDDEAAVAEFDKLFPPKEKGWQPSQEEFFIHSHSVIRP